MTWEFLKFAFSLWHHYLLGQHYRQDLIIDERHSHYRRYSVVYRKKQSLVKNFWIGAGLITLIFPFLHVAVILSMLTTFASFSVLDEAE